MNGNKSIKSFSQINLEVSCSNKASDDLLKKIIALFDPDIQDEISSVEIHQTKLTIFLHSVSCYNKIYHQSNYWLMKVEKLLKDNSKINIKSLNVLIKDKD